MKYPIGIQTFDRIREGGYVYVDKTALIYELVTTGNIYFLSRPRRFGKSLLVSTLDAYFRGKKELFEGLAIASLEQEWLEYPVFRIDFNGGPYTQPGILEATIEGYLGAWEEVYGKTPYYTTTGDRFRGVLERASQQYGRRAVVLIDEYDKPILDALDTPQEPINRELLKVFYSTLKSADASLRFVLLTGVTKFSQVSVFSGFNQPFDISMTGKYDALCGITEEELYSCFSESIKEMAAYIGCGVDELKLMLKQRYDGYHFSERMLDVYNPFSLLNAFGNQSVRDYWFSSGTPEYLIRLLSEYGEGIDMLSGKYYAPSEFIDCRATKAYPLPMIYQSGYFTIKDYDRRRERFQLDFPNNEVKSGFLTLAASSYFGTTTDTRNVAQDMAFALEDGEPEGFVSLLTSFLADIPYTMRRKTEERERERYFQYTFYLILRLMSAYTIYIEKVQSGGRVDCVVETDKYVYIFEFKLDGTADEALAQIEEKGYALPYANDSRQVRKLGISFSSQTGTVEEWGMR